MVLYLNIVELPEIVILFLLFLKKLFKFLTPTYFILKLSSL